MSMNKEWLILKVMIFRLNQRVHMLRGLIQSTKVKLLSYWKSKQESFKERVLQKKKGSKFHMILKMHIKNEKRKTTIIKMF